MYSLKPSKALSAFLLFLLFVSSAAQATDAPKPSQSAPQAEVRALWVDGFGPGIRTPEEARQLIANAKKIGINTLIVQVRRRADSLYRGGPEPMIEEFPIDPAFDPLQNIIDLAHKEGMEVHAWMNAMTVWKKQDAPKDPKHIFNLHGPKATGRDNWLTANPGGEVLFPVGYFLDAGNPDVVEHLVKVYTNVVRKYAVDGIHFDYIRYPETEDKDPDVGVGYNPISLERFYRATGRTDNPKPSDPRWNDWRRQQISQLVRRVYLESKAINPKIKVSAATIAWGQSPNTELEYQTKAAPMRLVFQDWLGWMKNGFLDMAVPMNYSRETDPRTRDFFTGWINYEKQHKAGRFLVIGVGSYMNSSEGTLAQIQRVRQPANGAVADGISFFSYGSFLRASNMQDESSPAVQTVSQTNVQNGNDRPRQAGATFDCLITGDNAPFVKPATLPKATWIEQPTLGMLAGTIRDNSGAIDGAKLEVRKAGWWPWRHTDKVVADGNGFFGMANLKPGKYEVAFKTGAARTKSVAEVVPGKVAQVSLTVP
jgi:uncharacterized lipoprotein YddW (UPF0748 family)